MEGFKVASSKATVLCDLFAYDGGCALACLEELIVCRILWSAKTPIVLFERVVCLFFSFQEVADGRTCNCASLVLDNSGSELLGRISNTVYEKCRAQSLKITGFPDYGPIVQALKNEQVVDRQKSFRVSAQRHDQLLVLESLAKKWMENEDTAGRAEEIIKAHNAEFNTSEDYWLTDSTRPGLCHFLLCHYFHPTC